jgi:hypothetical protein
MRFRHILVALLALVPLLLVLVASDARGASGAVSYDVSGNYTFGSACNVVSCSALHTYTYIGGATCSANCEVVPTLERSFFLEIHLSGRGMFRSSACISKRVSGDLEFISAAPVDPPGPPIFIFASLKGHDFNFQGFELSGTVTGPTWAGAAVSGFLSHPSAPDEGSIGCNPGQFTGVMNLYLPAPV